MKSESNEKAEPVTFRTEDGKELAGLMIRPRGTAKAACVIHSATGVPKEYYLKFAKWLAAGRGVAALVYDYRGFGGSRKGAMKAQDATMSDWGVKDQSAALDFLISEFPNTEIWTVGHSLGGLFLNAHRQSGKVSRAFAVASGPNYWRNNPWSYMPMVIGLWWVAGPAATAVKGYLPGTKLGLGADLPKGVYWEWRRWCLSRDFYRADYGKTLPALSALKNPTSLRLIGIEDDKAITPEMVKKLAGYYGGAVSYRLLAPKDIGAKEIGHMGVFREKNKKAWPLIID